MLYSSIISWFYTETGVVTEMISIFALLKAP